jgi:hypothetical protein
MNNVKQISEVTVQLKSNPTLRDAAEANLAWFEAEDYSLGSFNDRMDLCKYVEWACKKALGQEVGEFKGVPRFILTIGRDHESV